MRNSRASAEKIKLLFGMCFALFLGSCGSSPTVTWKESSISPDKRWVATARSEIIGGMGGQFDQTIVTMTEDDRDNTTKEILILSHEYPTINLSMRWVSPTNLLIKYAESGRPGDKIIVNFRAITYGGASISVDGR